MSGNDVAVTGSPWPPLVAVGLAVAEVGVLFDAFPVAVGGVVLFGAAIGGFVAESDHLSSRPQGMVVAAVLLGALGGVVAAVTTYQTRGTAVLVGAGLLVALALVDRVTGRNHRSV